MGFRVLRDRELRARVLGVKAVSENSGSPKGALI